MDKRAILIIEDDAVGASLIRQLLIKIGHSADDIFIAKSLAEVERYAPAHKKELLVVLTDLTLPDLPSQETFSKVQAQFPYVPVIVLTGAADIEIAIRTMEEGAEDYLIKGELDPKSLAKAIRYAVIRKKKANDYIRLVTESPSPIYIYEEETYRFLAVNNAALFQYGYSRAEFLSMKVTGIRPQKDLNEFYQVIKTVSDEYFDFGRWQHIKKNGDVFYVHIYAHNTSFEGKKARIVMAIDIDKKVKSEMALLEKTTEIVNILESITDAFFSLNKNWEVTYFNKAAETILEQKREDVLGKNIWDYFKDSRKGKFLQEYECVVNEKKSVHFEEYYAPKDVWVSVNAYPTPGGIAIYFIDITEQKRTQEKLKREEQNLRAVINNTKDVIWSVDKDFQFLSANNVFWERVTKKVGKPKKALTNEDFSPEMFEPWKAYYERAIKGEAFKIVWHDDSGGKESFEEVSFNPITDEENNVVGISCFSRDITSQHIHLRTIEKQNEQFVEIARIQSHEVRNHVASIMGLIPLFNRENKADPVNEQVLDMLELASQRLDAVIRKITTLATNSRA